MADAAGSEGIVPSGGFATVAVVVVDDDMFRSLRLVRLPTPPLRSIVIFAAATRSSAVVDDAGAASAEVVVVVALDYADRRPRALDG